MFELTIKDNVYGFNFGIGFVKELSKSAQQPIDGMKGVTQDVGLELALAKLVTGDVLALVDVLDKANKGCEPRITRKALEEYIEDESTDIDALFDEVLGFFKSSNATKKKAAEFLKAIDQGSETAK